MKPPSNSVRPPATAAAPGRQPVSPNVTPRLPVGLHQALLVIVPLFSCMALPALLQLAHAAALAQGQGPAGALRPEWSLPLLWCAVLLTYMPVQWLMQHVVAARCAACGGAARPQGARPVRYVCSCCGHEHAAQVSQPS